MFKIPDWDDDVKNVNANWKISENKKQNGSTKNNKWTKSHTIKINNDKSEITTNGSSIAANTKKKKHKNIQNGESHIEFNKNNKNLVLNPFAYTNGKDVNSTLTVKNSKKRKRNIDNGSVNNNTEVYYKKKKNLILANHKEADDKNDIESTIKEVTVKDLKKGNQNNGNESVNKYNLIDYKKKLIGTDHCKETIKNDKETTRQSKHFKDTEAINGLELYNVDTDKLDELILDRNRKKLNDAFKIEVMEDLLFSDNDKKSTINRSEQIKKEKFKKILQMQSNRNSIKCNGNKLRERMLEKLKAAQFRYLNEKLYTSSGSEAQQLFQTDPAAFQTYHQGYRQQLKKWPVNPLDVIVKKILKMPKSHIIADMGCGEAELSRRVPQTVRSFDLVSSAPGVEACDMARTPLLRDSVDVAVYCLALMGTDLVPYLVEANRVLKRGGQLMIAEVESRFNDAEAFARDVQRLGFKLTDLDKTHDVFFFMEFKKIQDPPSKRSKLPTLTLKPCLYKRR